jgi:hypothetical protein
MKIAIRIIRLVTIVLLVTIFFFVVTAVYSITQLGLSVGAVQMFPSSEGVNFSLPFSISNNGYYELADLNVTTRITDANGTLLDQSETIIPSILKGATVNSTHTVPVSFDTIMAIDYVPLLLNDSTFKVELFGALNFARAIPIQVSANTTIPWGAPLSNFSVGSLSISTFNSTHGEARIPVSFVNHAVLDLIGTLRLEFLSVSRQVLAFGETAVNVPSGGSFSGEINTYPRQEDLLKITDGTTVRAVFETPMFTVEWEESYG